ncbi:MAG TPA: hypothetical protein VEN81_16580 [Planctomycetota bacterium]|nr:hypothetical protein [Planctomycetota bacterium]
MFQPASFRHPALRQAVPTPAAPAAAPVAAPAAVIPPAPAPGINTTKLVTGALTLAVLGSAAYGGFYTGKHTKGLARVAGYVGGIGAGLLGVAVLGAAASLPSVSQTLTTPFNIQVQ